MTSENTYGIRTLFEESDWFDNFLKEQNVFHIQNIMAWKTNVLNVCLSAKNKLLTLESDLSILKEQAQLPFNEQNLSSVNASCNIRDISFENDIVEVFFLSKENILVLDIQGSIHSLKPSIDDASNELMEIDDIIDSSPPTKSLDQKWENNCITNIDCKTLITSCLMSESLCIIVEKDLSLMILIYDLVAFKIKGLVNLDRFCSHKIQNVTLVVSSCLVASLSPQLKQLFEDNLDTMDKEIIIVGLVSGLVVWFSPNSPKKGPFVLCSTHSQVQALHWMTDGSKINNLAIVGTSGRVIVFRNKQHKTISLPDNVKTSLCFKNLIITSNLVDCYTCEIKFDEDVILDCAIVPIKGVSAITNIPGSDLLLAVTLHGSVYCFDPVVVPAGKSSQFIIPPQIVLDNMLTQTQHLEEIYKQIDHEDEFLKAVSSASVAHSLNDLFSVKLKILTADEFSISINITSNLVFNSKLWMASLEVVDSQETRHTSLRELKEDLTIDSKLVFIVTQHLSVGDVICVDLLCSFEEQIPMLTVPVAKINVTASYMLTSTKDLSNKKSSNVQFQDSVLETKIKPTNFADIDCNVQLKIPDWFETSTLFSKILQNSKHRIYEQEWSKLEGGKKLNLHLYVDDTPVFFYLEEDSRQLQIICSSAELCHQLKENIMLLLLNQNQIARKEFSEDIILDIQGLYQSYELERMKDVPDMEVMDSYRRKARKSISLNLM